MKIEKLIFGGFGLTRDEKGKPIFVYKAVPEDDIEITIVSEKKSYSKAIIKKIIKPSKFRITPICPAFNDCGGCEHQNISYNQQLIFKNEIFKEALAREKIVTRSHELIKGSDSPFYYRNVTRFMFALNYKNEIVYQMHNYLYNNPNIVIDSCFLQSEMTDEIMQSIRNTINNFARDKNSFWQLRIREGKATNQIMVEIMTDNNVLPAKSELIDALKIFNQVKSIYHTYSYNRDINKLTRNLLYGSPVIYEKVGNFTFQISPESFFQTNSLGIDTLYDTIKRFADIKMNETVLDLYCGTGTIGIYLSLLAKNIIGVDEVSNAIMDAKDNAKINKIPNCEFIENDVEKYLKINKNKIDKIIVDPPRSGLAKNIIKYLVDLKPKKIIYVSCDPSTFARDIKLFENCGWKLIEVQPIDMFPQTHHIECVGVLMF